MNSGHDRTLGCMLARTLQFEEIELVSGANPPLTSRCVWPYMETRVDHHMERSGDHGGSQIICDPCDDVDFP